jgi:chromosome condensin MukBEF MukE localization factor
MKFFRAISRIKSLNGEKTDVSKTVSVLVLRVLIYPYQHPDGLRNVGFFTVQLLYMAGSPR